MIRTGNRIILALVLGALALACSTTKPAQLQARTEYDETVDWTELRSFRMASEQAAETSYTRYPHYERMVHTALVDELLKRGYALADNGPTDFRVAFELVFRGDRSPSMGTAPFDTNELPASVKGAGQTSTLIVKMLHPVTSKVMWTGTVSGFNVGVAPEKEFQAAVWRLLAEFPPITG
jgi:hypothetical protein